MGPERRAEGGQVLERGAGPWRLVNAVQGPAFARLERGHGHQVGLDLAVAVGGGQLVLRGDGVRVRAVLGDGREAVVQVLGRVAHVECGRIHQALGHKARVGVGAGAHRVVAHVLHAAGNHDVVGAEADAAGRGGHGGHGAGAHAVDGESGDGAGEAGQERRGAPQGQALVAGLGGGGDGHLVHAFGRQRRIAAKELADAFDHQVIGAGSGVDAFLAGPAEGCADAVNKNDVADSARISAASVVAHV